jgi:hypothetical protein
MGWTQIAQVVLRIIDRLHGSTAQHHPHQNRQVARPPSMLRMPFTTDKLPGGTSRSRAFQARYRRRLAQRRGADELGQKAEFEPVIVAAVLLESGLKAPYARLRMRLPPFRKDSSYQRIGRKRRGVSPFAIERYSGDDTRTAAIVWSLNLPRPESRARKNGSGHLPERTYHRLQCGRHALQ